MTVAIVYQPIIALQFALNNILPAPLRGLSSLISLLLGVLIYTIALYFIVLALAGLRTRHNKGTS